MKKDVYAKTRFYDGHRKKIMLDSASGHARIAKVSLVQNWKRFAMAKESVIDTDYRKCPVCPHCGHEHEEWWDFEICGEEVVQVECRSCEYEYEIYPHVSYTFSTFKLEDET